MVVRGATTALTRRTTLRKAFLAPWHPLVAEIWFYGLGSAQRKTGVAVHHTVLNPSHHHTSVTPSRKNLGEFLRLVHRDTSCALNTLLANERYDCPHELFDDRPTHAMRLLDAGAQASHLTYENLNNVAAGLVARPEHMPGRIITWRDWKRGYIEVRRPPVYFGTDRPEVLRLYLTPPPLLYRAFGGDMDALVYHMEKLTEDGGRQLREQQKRAPMGAKALLRLHPFSEPTTLRETGGQRVPTYKIGARGILGQQMDIHCALEVTGFRREHDEVRIARRDGDLERVYPYGTYQADVIRGEPVEPEPSIDAIVARPGPLLHEVKAELAAMGRRDKSEASAVVAEVKEAFREEAAEIVEHDHVELCAAPERVSSDPSSSDEPEPVDERAPVVIRHRFDPKPKRRPSAARIVVLRDRRRGRPPKGHGSHGSDPPD